MYAKRIQIRNYGPIDHVDITFPFADGDENPKPVLLVGENGSGKSILLSHIVDELMWAQGKVYPENSEMEPGKVYKFLVSSYIKSGKEYYWKRVDFEEGIYYKEMLLDQKKQEASTMPADLVGSGMADFWNAIPAGNSHGVDENFQERHVEKILDGNSVLYFPHNRFEEPAWLNERNLRAKVQYTNIERFQGYTYRSIINRSPMHDNKNWLFDVLFDYAVLGINAPQTIAGNLYTVALNIVRKILHAEGELLLGIKHRQNRAIYLERDKQVLVPNIFQLSSGETALLNLFLSILRDFDLSRTPFTMVEDVRGIVVVDEIDLHLHAIHQHEVLPALMQMFPRVQFIVTTHSPLFVLGMENAFGKDGFALYRLPEGQHIGPEEFSEFGNAYRYFTETKRFADAMNEAINSAQKPVVFVEGKTDKKYLQKAAELLGREAVLDDIELMEAGGTGNLAKIWNFKFAETVMPRVVLLYDCDNCDIDCDKGQMSRRKIPLREDHPLKNGIENLFEKAILKRARQDKPAYIDIEDAHSKTERGREKNVPEEWSVNEDEKTNLCDWLCGHGTADDFKHFNVVFDIIEDALGRGK